MSDMYEEITHPNINPFAGKCPQECIYCYVDEMKVRPASSVKYSGELRIHEKAMKPVKYGTRFLCSCNDLFAANVSIVDINTILDWAEQKETVTWWIQTKNPEKMLNIFANHREKAPNFVLGMTLETNRDTSEISKAPIPSERARPDYPLNLIDYITIEPIMDFDYEEFVSMIWNIGPKFVNIGADSRPKKYRDLPEPSAEKTRKLIAELETFTKVKIKPNLKRILGVGL